MSDCVLFTNLWTDRVYITHLVMCVYVVEHNIHYIDTKTEQWVRSMRCRSPPHMRVRAR